MRRLHLLLLLTLVGLSATAASTAVGISPAKPDHHQDPYTYANITQLHQAMQDGKLTSVQLVKAAIRRIHALDKHGPDLHAVIELNPDALSIARKLDRERAQGKAHGLLWGIPILLKDNIDTGDRMLTSAGSLALMGAPAPRDASFVAKLRAAGMVILGKANLSEWANYRGNHSIAGWSGRGGLTRNPYVLDRTACGSSSGSAVSVSVGYVPVAVGTETDGSIMCPSSMNGVVGIKPSVGLVSRTGIIPVSHAQDTAGPMARDVRDAAILLTAMAGSDPRDPATVNANQHATDYSRFLIPNGLKGKRIGIVRALSGYQAGTDKLFDQAIAAMRAAGAIIIDPVVIPHLHAFDKDENIALSYEFKHDINAYLATRPGVKEKNLTELIAFNRKHAKREMPWFGQQLFIEAEKRGPLTDPVYIKARTEAQRLAGPEGIDAAMNQYHLDALVAPTTAPAWVVDPVDGGHYLGGSAGEAAVAGYPDISVPMGLVHGLPVGISFFGRKWSEPKLITIAYGFEQATHDRRNPTFIPHIGP